MQVASSRFVGLEVREDAVLTFPGGIPGLPGERYALVAHDPASPFFWLHSLEDAGVAVPVTNPWIFFGDYEVRLADDETARLELEDAADAEVLCVVRAAPDPADVTINLAGPIVIHRGRRRGRQIVNDAGGYSVRHPLFAEVDLNDAQPAAPAVPMAAAIT